MNFTSPIRLIIAVGLLTALCAVLLAINIERPCYWIDEKVSMDIAGAGSPGGVVSAVIAGERRPPGYHLGLWVFLKIFGNREVSGRLYSALWALLLLPGLFLLARELSDERAALLVSILAATSPVLIAYGQTIRYYTMVAALAAWAFALFFMFLRRGGKGAIPYLLVTAALLFTDYPAYGVVLAQNIIVAWLILHKERAMRELFWRWALMQASLAACAFLLLPTVLSHGQRDFGVAELSHSLSGTVLRLIYPFYAWTVGENIFPWSPFAAVGVLLSLWLAFLGVKALLRSGGIMPWVIALGVPFVVAQALLFTVASDSPFINAPARSMASFGLLLVVIGAGISSLSRRWVAIAGLAAIVMVHGLGLANYYRGQDFINTVYNTPAREVASFIAARATPGDVIVTEKDAIIEHYLPQELKPSHFYANEGETILRSITGRGAGQVWQAVMGRDRTRSPLSQRLAEIFRMERPVISQYGFGEQDATYRKVKACLLGREPYRFRFVLYQYGP
jgi:hypothetical protein